MNFNENPSGIVGAKSSLIYQVFDSNWNTQTNFRYRFSLYVWHGTTTIPATPIQVLEKKADVYETGRAWIDVHKLVQQFLSDNFLIDGTYKPNIINGACYFAVKVQAFWDGGSSGIITSPVTMATNGYSYTPEGLNNSYTNAVYTDKNEIYIPETTTSYYLWYNASVITGITIGGTTKTPNAVTGSDNTIQGIDLVQLLTESGVSGDTTVTFVRAAGNIVFNIYRDCVNKYGQVTAHFLNKYGVYDSLVFNGVSKKNLAIQKETYSKPVYTGSNLRNAWDYGVGINASYNVNAVTQMTLNTNWISEAYVQVIEQMFFSNNILVKDTTIKSARVIDSAFSEKKRTNDKLIDYTIQIEFNQPMINKIVR
jgi:hypothetical protein